MPDTHRPHEASQRPPGAQAARAAVMLQKQWLQRQLLQRHPRLWSRFLAIYAQLQRLPRRWRRRLVRKAAAVKLATTLAGVALLLSLHHTPARALEITVDDGFVIVDDSDDKCSLREAIINANEGGMIHNDCDPGSPYADTITLPPNGTFTLTDIHGDYYDSDTGLPLITSEITIEGNGATIKRDAVAGFRLLAVGSGGKLTIKDTTLSGGRSDDHGGAIFNYSGDVTISNSTFSGNNADDSGGAIYNNDEMTVYNSTFSGNGAFDGGAIYNQAQLTIYNSIFNGNMGERDGGAIYNDGGLMIYNSSFSSNRGYDAGAIYNNDELTIHNSTFSDNYAGDFSEAEGDGGAILNDASLSIYNSTFSGNTAYDRGGAIFNWEDTIISNSTFRGNTTNNSDGGAIENNGQLTIGRILVSGNSAYSDGDEISNAGSITNNGYNLFGHDGITIDAALYGFTPDPTDIIATNGGENEAILDNILAKNLDENGGPQTGAPGSAQQIKTLALKENSPAIDAAPSAACEDQPVNGRDQRGYLRNADGDNNDPGGTHECDIGAFEYNSAPAQDVYMTAAGPGVTDDGVAFGKEDILFWNGLEWSNFFDGTAHGLTTKHDLNAIHVNAADDIYLSFFQNKIKTAGVGNVFGHDILHYDGSNFSLFFDGSDVGLTTTAEKIDALHILDGDVDLPGGGSCNAYLLISTLGTGKVPASGGGNIKFQGEDILGFCLTNSGANTAGFWHMVLDGSAEGMPKNSTDSISATDDGSVIFLTTKALFNVDSASGDHSMVYAFNTSTGDFSGPLFSAPENGLDKKVDGLHVAGNIP